MEMNCNKPLNKKCVFYLKLVKAVPFASLALLKHSGVSTEAQAHGEEDEVPAGCSGSVGCPVLSGASVSPTSVA